MSPARRLLALLALGALVAAGSGCAGAQAVRVHPWERAQLADLAMDPDQDALGAALTEHVYFAREASSGGRGVGGSGCGCN